jgi:hypothetical protein
MTFTFFCKQERSRQSARECRARKKLRYQYLDEMILERERANIILREELLRYQVNLKSYSVNLLISLN